MSISFLREKKKLAAFFFGFVPLSIHTRTYILYTIRVDRIHVAIANSNLDLSPPE